MKALAVLILPVLFFVASVTSAFPQAEDLEAKIRRLDLEAAKAIQLKDERAIKRIFTADSVTNNPRNGLTHGSSGVIVAARSNLIDYHSFERNVESIQLLGDTAIVMGNEVVVFRTENGGPGETVRRRYTNIWMKRDEQWGIVARHANIICPQSNAK